MRVRRQTTSTLSGQGQGAGRPVRVTGSGTGPAVGVLESADWAKVKKRMRREEKAGEKQREGISSEKIRRGKISEEEAQAQLAKMTRNQFTLEDFKAQLGQFKKLGSMSKLMKMLPEPVRVKGGKPMITDGMASSTSGRVTTHGDSCGFWPGARP